jgi:hypothetical protein
MKNFFIPTLVVFALLFLGTGCSFAFKERKSSPATPEQTTAYEEVPAQLPFDENDYLDEALLELDAVE